MDKIIYLAEVCFWYKFFCKICLNRLIFCFCLFQIGLHSLSAITRGSVRIEKNPSLCYVDTVNWKLLIEKNYHSIAYTSQNKPQAECPSCQENCSQLENSSRRNCWNNEHCQKVIDAKCHPECVKGCDGPSNEQCHFCKNYKNGINGNKCVSNCSYNNR